MSAFLLSQVLVSIAGILFLISFQFKARKHVLAFIVCGACFGSAHFFALGNNTAGSLAAATALRLIVCYFTTSKKWMIFFMLFAVLCFAVTYQAPVNLLPLSGMLIATWGTFQEGDKKMRQFYFFSTICWLSNNIIIGTPGGAIVESIFMVSNIVGYVRFYVVKNPTQKI